MKTILKLMPAFALLFVVSFSNAQTEKKSNDQMKTSERVIMKDSTALLCKGDKCAPLTEAYTCTDGCKVSVDGTITMPDGTTMQLKKGYEISKAGKVTMIPHGQSGHICSDECHKMHKKM